LSPNREKSEKIRQSLDKSAATFGNLRQLKWPTRKWMALAAWPSFIAARIFHHVLCTSIWVRTRWSEFGSRKLGKWNWENRWENGQN